MTSQEAHRVILSRAVGYANLDPRKPDYLGGSIFRLPTQFNQLELKYDSQEVGGAIKAMIKFGMEKRSEDEIWSSLTQIVRDAVHKALQNEPDVLGSLIVEYARNAPTS